MAKIGIRQVAAEAGVSISTVSKAFNPDSKAGMYVSETTLERVRKAARKLNYTPNYGAKLLRGHDTKNIGFTIAMPEQVSASYLSEAPVRILNGLGPTANTQGYQILLINGEDYRYYMDIKRIDALVLTGYQHIDNPRKTEMLEMFQHFNELKYPYVIINNSCGEMKLPSINCDNTDGMRQISELILERQFDSVGFIGELTSNPQQHHKDRVKELQHFMSVKPGVFRVESTIVGLRDDVPDVPRKELYTHADGWTGIHYLHEKRSIPQCIVCGNDNIAFGALSACYELGIKVPDDLAIIGFDGSKAGGYSCPALTTVVQPLEEYGKIAFEYLMKKIQNPEYCEEIIVKPELIIRKSC